MSTLTHPLQHISGKDHDRRLRRHCQRWRQNIHQPPLCWWHRWLSKRGRRTGKFSWASWQSLHSLRHEWTEAWDSHKLQIPGLSYNWWGFQAWDTLQNSSDNGSIDKAETSLDWQEYLSQLQDTTDRAPLLHPSSCILVNHGPSQRNSKEEYKPWKWGATARYYTSHTKTMLPTRKSVPRSNRQLDHTKTFWRS